MRIDLKLEPRGNFVAFDASDGDTAEDVYRKVEKRLRHTVVLVKINKYVRNYIADLEAGKIDRFDLFAGPIVDNKGNTVIAEGEKMEDSDLDTFDCSEMGCKYGMHWWADGIQAELP